MRKKIELLAPAGNLEILKAAVDMGADAVYCGLGRFNARVNADNLDLYGLEESIDYAHLRSSIIGRNVTIVTVDGEADLCEFGRIHFIDWDQTRGRTRTVQVMIIGE